MPNAGEVSLSDYRLFKTEEYRKRLDKIPGGDAVFINRKLESQVYPQLKAAPFFGPNIKKLRGYDPETWRYRVGRFRIFYSVDEVEKIVFLATIDHRKDAYR